MIMGVVYGGGGGFVVCNIAASVGFVSVSRGVMIRRVVNDDDKL